MIDMPIGLAFGYKSFQFYLVLFGKLLIYFIAPSLVIYCISSDFGVPSIAIIL